MSRFQDPNTPGPLLREGLPHPGQNQGGAGRAPVIALGTEDAVAPLALQFAVRYTLFEYLSFMWQHAGYLIRRRRIGTVGTYWLLTKSTAAAGLHFVLLRRARRTYEFTVDQHGIVRSSGTGVTLVPWRDVAAIRSYSRGYMMVLERGTLPIPFRCLDRAQSAAMDGYAATLKAARA